MKVIHDGDAAYEDIMALCLLLLNTDVVAVTVTYGESTTEIGAKNMERVCRWLKPSLMIPVAYGSNSAIEPACGTPFPDFITTEANMILKDTDVPIVIDSEIKESAVQLIYDTLISSEEKIIIVATGPLTNIAQLLLEHPDCVKNIDRIVIMGGAVKVPGNISDLIYDTENAVAEWNIYADRKAADVVFNTQNLSIMLVPIDITRQMPMTKEFYARLDQETLPPLKLVRDMLTSLLQQMKEELFYGKLQFWDSLSAMITLDSSMATFEELSLRVDLTTGQTMINEEPIVGVSPLRVATRLNNVSAAYDTFFGLMKTGSKSLSGLNSYNGTVFGASAYKTLFLTKPNRDLVSEQKYDF